MQLPIYPKFHNIKIQDKKIIENFLVNYAPYSDFNFASLYSWDIDRKNKYSILNNNLVLQFSDYSSGEKFFMFIGINKIEETIIELITNTKKSNLINHLKLIPADVVKLISDNKNLQIEKDRGNDDYILYIPRLIDYKGKLMARRRNMINRFLRNYENCTYTLDVEDFDIRIQQEIVYLFRKWTKYKNLSYSEVKREYLALKKLLKYAKNLNIRGVMIYINGELQAFSLFEILQKKYAIIHFQKTDVRYEGITEYLMQSVAKILNKHGCLYINYEQDLGIEGLRRSKKEYKPIRYLHKHIIKLVEG